MVNILWAAFLCTLVLQQELVKEINGQDVIDPNEDEVKLESSLGNSTRVYNGVNANAGGLKFIVYIVKRDEADPNSYSHCAGSILNSGFVLTAAHCIASDPNAVNQGRVFAWAEPANDVTRLDGFPATHPNTGQYRRVRSAQWPGDYKQPGRHDNDIAVYELENPFQLIRGRVETICIFRGNWENQPVVLGGWGKYNCKNGNVFKAATGNTMVNSDCARNYLNTNPPVTITSRQICARLRGNNNELAEQANGDSGAPLFVLRNGIPQQIGVVNFDAPSKNGCAHRDYPGVYARTSAYIDFIASTGVNNFVCNQ